MRRLACCAAAHLTARATVQIGRGIDAQAEVELPIHRSPATTQRDSPAIFQVGISRAF